MLGLASIQKQRRDQSRDVVAQDITLLLVEDEEILRKLFAHVLSDAGYKVLVARTAVDALAIACEPDQRINVLVSDLALPDMDGRLLAHHIWQRRPGVRVLLISGHLDEPTPIVAGNGPALAFLPKPFAPSALSRKVREILLY